MGSAVCIGHSAKFFSALHKNAPSSKTEDWRLIKIRYSHTHHTDFCVVCLFLERLRLVFLFAYNFQCSSAMAKCLEGRKRGRFLVLANEKGDRHLRSAYKSKWIGKWRSSRIMDTFLILMELILWYKTTVFSVGFGIIFNITFKFISWNVLFICYYGLNKDWKNTSLFYFV